MADGNPRPCLLGGRCVKLFCTFSSLHNVTASFLGFFFKRPIIVTALINEVLKKGDGRVWKSMKDKQAAAGRRT